MKQWLWPFAHKQILEEYVAKMVKAGIIQESTSPWSANVVIVKKPDGSARIVIDYRRLNAVSVKEKFNIPNIINSG